MLQIIDQLEAASDRDVAATTEACIVSKIIPYYRAPHYNFTTIFPETLCLIVNSGPCMGAWSIEVWSDDGNLLPTAVADVNR